jgi:hypothetical protein
MTHPSALRLSPKWYFWAAAFAAVTAIALTATRLFGRVPDRLTTDVEGAASAAAYLSLVTACLGLGARAVHRDPARRANGSTP